MAKQRGIHQIKGKINNLCYYEQKYVRGGLIRRINEAMSERLKTDPVFANTRYANTIFGAASVCASVLLEFFSSRQIFLFKPYRHALLTRYIMSNLSLKVASATYPSLLYRDFMYSSFAFIFDNIVKNKIRDSFPSLPYLYSNLSVNSTISISIPVDELFAFCEKNKCIGVQFSVSAPHYIYESSYISGSDGYLYPQANPGGRGSYENWLKDSQSQDELEILLNTGDTDEAYTFWIVYAIPILRMEVGRPITGKAGAACGILSFRAS